jgi:hypothetical protein
MFKSIWTTMEIYSECFQQLAIRASELHARRGKRKSCVSFTISNEQDYLWLELANDGRPTLSNVSLFLLLCQFFLIFGFLLFNPVFRPLGE